MGAAGFRAGPVRFVVPLSSLLFAAYGLLCPQSARAQTTPLETVVVTATRGASSTESSPFSTRVLSGADFQDAPALTIDGALRAVPSFSLFRRSDSLVAHPTTQGVSLRGLGPSGASRTLVLLDGVPLNDPFGGWVTWSKVPREGIARAEIVSGGGAAAWGNAALGGVVQLLTEPPSAASGGTVDLRLGDFGTRSAEWRIDQPVADGLLQVSGRVFSTDGYRVVAPEDAGAVDVAAGSRHQTVDVQWTQSITPTTRAHADLRWFHERRSNGTPYTRNATGDLLATVGLEGRPAADTRWTATAYAEDESFSSTFGSVNSDRTAETPASDQHDVPAKAMGAAATAEWGRPGSVRTVVGGDIRQVRGESREWYSYSNGLFARARESGGKQLNAGLFAQHERPLARHWSLTVGSRLDFWNDSDGFRRERERVSGASLRNDRYVSRDGWEWSPGAGLVWNPTRTVRWRLSGQRAFRRPTLNELYRPFRVGNVITETNPDLGTERNATIETGLAAEWRSFSVEGTAFWNELRGAVGNVTVARGPGNVPGFGFIPAGGIGRLRENIDRVRVRGVELSARWQATADWALTADALLNDAEVTRASAAPALVGKRVAQVPRTSAAVGLLWKRAGWRFAPRARWMGAQFEDDENALRLAPALVVDAALAREIGKHAELFVTAENLFNERIETGRSAAMVVIVGTPRFATAGVRVQW